MKKLAACVAIAAWLPALCSADAGQCGANLGACHSQLSSSLLQLQSVNTAHLDGAKNQSDISDKESWSKRSDLDPNLSMSEVMAVSGGTHVAVANVSAAIGPAGQSIAENAASSGCVSCCTTGMCQDAYFGQPGHCCNAQTVLCCPSSAKCHENGCAALHGVSEDVSGYHHHHERKQAPDQHHNDNGVMNLLLWTLLGAFFLLFCMSLATSGDRPEHSAQFHARPYDAGSRSQSGIGYL